MIGPSLTTTPRWWRIRAGEFRFPPSGTGAGEAYVMEEKPLPIQPPLRRLRCCPAPSAPGVANCARRAPGVESRSRSEPGSTRPTVVRPPSLSPFSRLLPPPVESASFRAASSRRGPSAGPCLLADGATGVSSCAGPFCYRGAERYPVVRLVDLDPAGQSYRYVAGFRLSHRRYSRACAARVRVRPVYSGDPPYFGFVRFHRFMKSRSQRSLTALLRRSWSFFSARRRRRLRCLAPGGL